jgi:hypothetical protein
VLVISAIYRHDLPLLFSIDQGPNRVGEGFLDATDICRTRAEDQEHVHTYFKPASKFAGLESLWLQHSHNALQFILSWFDRYTKPIYIY